MKLISKNNFSLIELLVVIAVLSVLIQLLFPALQKSLATAHNLECKRQLGNISLGLNLYAEDNNDELPPRSGSFVYWAGKGTEKRKFGSHRRFLNPYIGGPYPAKSEVLAAKCPNDQFVYETWGASYIFNRWKVLDHWKTSTILSPSKFILFSDMLGLLLIANRNEPPKELHVHNKLGYNRSNFSFLDGHVISIDVTPGIKTTNDYTFSNEL